MLDRAWKRYTQQLRRQPFFAFGLPFLVFVVVGSYGLSQVTQLRYEMKDRKVSRVSAAQAASWKGKERVFDMQAEYRKMQATLQDDWEQKRVARPHDK